MKGNDLVVKLFCIDPARQMREAQERGIAAVFFSATLTPAGYFKRMFGCSETAAELILSSPFPPENLLIAIAGNVSTLYARREKTKDEIAQIILSMIQQKKGNYLVFFPSYEYLKLVHESFSALDAHVDIITQIAGMTETEREWFISRFSRDNRETLVGFAVLGGVFGEGIDLAGDRLAGAVIVGVGLPALCLERDLIREYYAVQSGEGFEFAYLYPGFNKVLQAAGRVIRSEEDRGAVLLIDSRFTSERYRELFPGEWRPVTIHNDAHLFKTAQKFWNS